MKIDWGAMPILFYFSDKPPKGCTQRAYRKISQDMTWEMTFNPEGRAETRTGLYYVFHTKFCIGGVGDTEDDALADLVKRLRKRMSAEMKLIGDYDETKKQVKQATLGE